MTIVVSVEPVKTSNSTIYGFSVDHLLLFFLSFFLMFLACQIYIKNDFLIMYVALQQLLLGLEGWK